MRTMYSRIARRATSCIEIPKSAAQALSPSCSSSVSLNVIAMTKWYQFDTIKLVEDRHSRSEKREARRIVAFAVINAVAVAVALVISGFWSAPAHAKLADGFNESVH